jgi:hypothetical protein
MRRPAKPYDVARVIIFALIKVAIVVVKVVLVDLHFSYAKSIPEFGNFFLLFRIVNVLAFLLRTS